jgi:hypothetical protein
MWKQKSYPSLMSLSEWLRDLQQRIAFFKKWIDEGEPPVFWLPGFYFPQGLLTAVLQKHSRATRVPVDHIQYEFEVLNKPESEIIKPPETGQLNNTELCPYYIVLSPSTFPFRHFCVWSVLNWCSLEQGKILFGRFRGRSTKN